MLSNTFPQSVGDGCIDILGFEMLIKSFIIRPYQSKGRRVPMAGSWELVDKIFSTLILPNPHVGRHTVDPHPGPAGSDPTLKSSLYKNDILFIDFHFYHKFRNKAFY